MRPSRDEAIARLFAAIAVDETSRAAMATAVLLCSALSLQDNGVRACGVHLHAYPQDARTLSRRGLN